MDESDDSRPGSSASNSSSSSNNSKPTSPSFRISRSKVGQKHIYHNKQTYVDGTFDSLFLDLSYQNITFTYTISSQVDHDLHLHQVMRHHHHQSMAVIALAQYLIMK